MKEKDPFAEFKFYCCPEADCKERSNSRDKFLKHALEKHPEAKEEILRLQIKDEIEEDKPSVDDGSNNHDNEAMSMNAEPWCVPKLEEYLFFCCPECEDIDHDKFSFIRHAFGSHPEVPKLHRKFLNMMRVRDPAYPARRPGFSKGTHKRKKNKTPVAATPETQPDPPPPSTAPPTNVIEEKIEVKKEVIEDDDEFSWPTEEDSSQPVQAFSSPVKVERKDSTEQELPQQQLENSFDATTAQDDSFDNTTTPKKNEFEDLMENVAEDDYNDDYPMIPPPEPQVQIKYRCESCDSMFTDFLDMEQHMKKYHMKKKPVDVKEEQVDDDPDFQPNGNDFDEPYMEPEEDNDDEFEPDDKEEDDDYKPSGQPVKSRKPGRPKGTKVKSKDTKNTIREIHTCDFCGKEFKGEGFLKKHYKVAHDGLGLKDEPKSWPCDRCEKVFTTSAYQLKVHIQRVHEATRDHVCKICQKAFVASYKLNHHIRVVHEGEKNHICTVCGRGFGTGSDMRKHIIVVHEKRKDFKCEYESCNFECVDRPLLEAHLIKEHGKEEIINYKCESCEKGFKTHDGLTIHTRLVHQGVKVDKEPGAVVPKVFPCIACNKTFPKPYKLKKHIRFVHQGIKDYKCDQCDKEFGTNKGLEYHVQNIHEGGIDKETGGHSKMSRAGIRNQQCHLCVRAFTCRKTLEKHIKRFHEGEEPEKNHQCEFCEKSFVEKASLQTHIKITHEKKFDFNCEYCGKAFGTVAHLRGHIKRVHETENNVRCDQCNKSFAYNTDLAKHIRTVHEGIKEHKCEYCGKSFAKANNMTDHQKRVHDVQKKEKCKYCDRSYLYKSELQRHIENIHGKLLKAGFL